MILSFVYCNNTFTNPFYHYRIQDGERSWQHPRHGMGAIDSVLLHISLSFLLSWFCRCPSGHCAHPVPPFLSASFTAECVSAIVMRTKWQPACYFLLSGTLLTD